MTTIKILLVGENNMLQAELFSLLMSDDAVIHYYNGIKFINRKYRSIKCQIWDGYVRRKILPSLIADMDIILVIFDPSHESEFDHMIKQVNGIVHDEQNKGEVILVSHNSLKPVVSEEEIIEFAELLNVTYYHLPQLSVDSIQKLFNSILSFQG